MPFCSACSRWKPQQKKLSHVKRRQTAAQLGRPTVKPDKETLLKDANKLHEPGRLCPGHCFRIRLGK